jgi:hypothetical protein
MTDLERELTEALRQIALYTMRDSDRRSEFHRGCDAHIAGLASDALAKSEEGHWTRPDAPDAFASGDATRQF